MKNTIPSKEQSFALFDSISSRYDIINRVLSMGRDLAWRKKLQGFLPSQIPLHILDIATGTADQIVVFLKKPQVKKVIGLDLSHHMLEIAQKKLEKLGQKSRWELLHGDAQNLPFSSNQFDLTSISFGIRNIPDPQKALQEMHRVLKPQGKCLILEFSLPTQPWIRKAHHFYLKSILPKVGGFLSNSYSSYKYLHQTIESFPSGPGFLSWMKEAGFSGAISIPYHFGAVSLYIGEKQEK